MAEITAEGKKIYQQIRNIVTGFLNAHVYEADVILRDERATAAVRLRKLVVSAYPKARITSSLVALAVKLSNGSATQPNEEGFFKKVVDWFF